jgi:uncharacterized membrane protein YoaK (UPF0700 family)
MLAYLRFLSGRERSQEADRHLGLTLAFVAGAVNAGGFLAVSQYTSHMTGVVSSVADNLALGRMDLVKGGLEALAAFVCGSAASSVLINWARRRRLHSQYALALLLEAALLLGFGMAGARIDRAAHLSASATVLLLCFIMGLQNAIITKVSDARIRTTHVTGLVTDLGIELGKLAYWNRTPEHGVPVRADRVKMALLASLLAMFVAGGAIGALGFKHAGFAATVPLALLLAALAVVPILDDVRAALG